jgi:hypothetical protein
MGIEKVVVFHPKQDRMPAALALPVFDRQKIPMKLVLLDFFRTFAL